MKVLFLLVLGCTILGSASSHYVFPALEAEEDFALKPYKLPV
ncbi:MAG TPA: hypothetical protein QGF02_03570 [Candidatus Babeliales bacterium]|nr:hypothetical protein [Candidatus Babeliales bacterium]